MTGFVVTTLVVGAVLVGALCVAMLFDVALAGGARALAVREVESRRWRPPFVRGQELFDWARSAACGTVDRVLREPTDARTPRRLMSDIEAGLEHALVPGSVPRRHAGPVPCPEVGQGVVALTAPEALALADCLREYLSPAELELMRRESDDNVGWIRRISSVYGSDAPCALQRADCVCKAWRARPLHCRAVHGVTLARATGCEDPWLDQDAFRHAEQICAGARVGLREGLGRVGLDDGLCEMHGALARALEVPNAAERWARGERLFAACLPGDVEALGLDSARVLH